MAQVRFAVEKRRSDAYSTFNSDDCRDCLLRHPMVIVANAVLLHAATAENTAAANGGGRELVRRRWIETVMDKPRTPWNAGGGSTSVRCNITLSDIIASGATSFA